MAFLQEHLVSQSELRLLATRIPNRRHSNSKGSKKGCRQVIERRLPTTTELVEIRKESLIGSPLLREFLAKLNLELGLRVKRHTKLVTLSLKCLNTGPELSNYCIMLSRHHLDLSLNLLDV